MTNPAGADGQKDQKNKLYLALGLGGIAVIALGFFVLLPMLNPNNSVKAPTNLVTPTGNTAPATANVVGGSGTSPLAGAPVTAPSAQFASLPSTTSNKAPGSNWRGLSTRFDPFKPVFAPTLPPPPTPTPVPPQIQFPGPPPIALPNPSGGQPITTVLAALPPVHIPNAQNNNPRVVLPPPLNREGDTTNLERSTNRRISGVIVGDRVSALLELTAADGTVTTRVVQPGDEVDGIQILRLERTNVNGQDTTRLIVRENGQERIVELRPSPNPVGTNGLDGEGGLGPGGFGPGRGGGPGGGFAPGANDPRGGGGNFPIPG